MPRFFADPSRISEKRIIIEGDDVNHISRVLRMHPGEEVLVSDGMGTDHSCLISSIEPDAVILDIQNSWPSYTELPVRITLFQGLPKADKMELIIQKTVELGVSEIVPVAMNRCVVKLDDKKSVKKTARWQSISESAAKQAGRGIIPAVREPMTYGEALKYAGEMDAILLPYENAEGMQETKRIISELKAKAAEKAAEKAADKEGAKDVAGELSIGVFIGPEGGFADEEISKANAAGAEIITLGKRILRTETAGLATMSILMYELEGDR
ncbi:MAG: 16S rRNA (uracil(1498)-N(3))-methyltransferase [Mogibacterium sp.]|nr:16S rRNA (uracil(1498)-N(3))-methyltransferase [Mogibacterium sp.]